MPSISKIRFTNVIYEDGNKRYNDEIFLFDGHNGAILLENGGGKTVLIQTALQAILPHTDLADRKIKHTLKLEESPAHIAIEWMMNDRPRRYVLTCVTLFLTKNGLDSYRYVYEYGENADHSIENIPFIREYNGKSRPADRGEIQEYFQYMTHTYFNAKSFQTIKDFKVYIEEQYHIIPKEWESIVKINSAEGGVEHFFDECKTTSALFDRLLIPTVEESMTGYKTDDFAETFEKHRSSFKEYKELKEKIAENQRIKQEMETYVRTFAGLNEKQVDYKSVKKLAKGYMEEAQQQKADAEKEFERLDISLQEWERANEELTRKRASYEIAVDKDSLQKISIQYYESYQALEAVKDRFDETEKNYYSLKLAEYKKKYRVEEEKKQAHEVKLEKLDEEQDVTELKDQLEQNTREIKAYFVELEEKLTKQQQELQFEIRAIQGQIETEERDFKKIDIEKTDIEGKKSRKDASIEYNKKEMKALETEILANPLQETIEEQQEVWIRMQNQLDLDNVSLTQRNKQLEQQKNNLQNELEETQATLETIKSKQTELETERKHFEDAHQIVKMKLAEMRSQWARIDSIYLKQDSLEKQLIEHIAKLEKDREQLLVDERLAYRFVDDYGTQDVFYADPFLAQQLESWKNQFSYLETGVTYIQSLNEKAEEFVDKFSLWPITLITTEKEKPKLLEKAIQTGDRLQFPVYVLSTDEASEIVRSGWQADKEWVAPSHWKINIDLEQFHAWKLKVNNQAEDVKNERLEKEKEKAKWEQLYKDFLDFLSQFSYVSYQQLKEELTTVNDQVYRLIETSKQHKGQLQDVEKELTVNRDKIATNRDVMNDLAIKIGKGTKYIQFKKENQSIEQDLLLLTDKLQAMGEKIRKKQKHITRLKERESEQQSDVRNLQTQIAAQIHGDRLFKKVQHAEPDFMDKSIEWLEQERNGLELQLNRISKGRRELEAYIRHATENMERYLHEMDQLRKENDGLHEDVEFPLNGIEKMSGLWEKRQQLHEQLTNGKDKVDRLKEAHDKQGGKVDSQISRYQNNYPDVAIIEFQDHLELVNQKITEEKTKLAEQFNHFQTSRERLNKQLKELNFVIIELDKFDTKHQFMDPKITKVLLSPEDVTEFMYNRKKYAKNVIGNLEDSFDLVEQEQKRVTKARNKFIDFCRKEIKEVKLREKAVQGVELKQTYEEVVQFKQYMEGTINNAIKFAEQSIISHDKDLEQFIVHIHTHIKKIADELKIIPKKTRVKVEDQWKEIYSFTIPEWEEQAGKTEIRQHIDWILEQLESEKYKDDNDKEDVGKMRKDLETWLQSKQLLRVVMKSQAMKVNCRKVTNDSKITTRSYSWEQSNVWSGGEKWSKNMTLFLGLLNYIAEKRQHIQPNMKRHRTVIVDNPFGKASSDHVLNPVFFIAEQLGFQIIALTAHAEGKYLRDYFPILYSCRLRQAAGSEKQIMTKEKLIHQAYFRDHDPQSLERLGETEQLELF